MMDKIRKQISATTELQNTTTTF